MPVRVNTKVLEHEQRHTASVIRTMIVAIACAAVAFWGKRTWDQPPTVLRVTIAGLTRCVLELHGRSAHVPKGAVLQYLYFTDQTSRPMIAEEIQQCMSALSKHTALESEDVVYVGAVLRQKDIYMGYGRLWQRTSRGKFDELSEGLEDGAVPTPWVDALTACRAPAVRAKV